MHRSFPELNLFRVILALSMAVKLEQVTDLGLVNSRLRFMLEDYLK